MKNAKKVLSTLVVATMLFGSGLISAYASNMTVGTISQGEKVYAPIKSIVEKMGGQVKRYESDKFTIYEINGKSIRLDDEVAFAQVDGKVVPYETKVHRGYTIPVYKKPLYKDGDTYVAMDFLTSSVGLKLEAKDGQVAFNGIDGGNSVAMVEVPSNGTQPSSNKGSSTNVVETNRPAPKPSTPTSSSGSSSGGSSTKPSNPGGTPTPTTPPPTPSTPPPTPTQPPAQTKVYTGSEIKQKLYSLGFTNYNSGLRLNPYGKDGNGSDDYATFNVLSGEKDMALFIYDSDPATDQKFRTMFNWILPNSGGKLYSILDNPNLNSQTITLDGRTVQIVVASTYTKIAFGPIIK